MWRHLESGILVLWKGLFEGVSGEGTAVLGCFMVSLMSGSGVGDDCATQRLYSKI